MHGCWSIGFTVCGAECEPIGSVCALRGFGRSDATASVTVCAFTTDPTDAPLFRLLVAADEETGIREPSRLMVDKITTVVRSKLGKRVGRLSDEDMVRLDRAILVFLGIAGR